MTKIVALCGKAQSGKTTLSNFLHGHEMKRHEVIEKFSISQLGQLVVNATYYDESGREYDDMGILDLQQRNDEFYQYASRRIWPFIRGYNFADSLKELCVMLFNIPPECVYGTDAQKNQIQEHLLWENMPGVITDTEFYNADMENKYVSMAKDVISKMTFHSPGPMTAREFMQYLGTDIMRKIYEPVWVENCFRRIEEDAPEIAVIGDCRFLNEINYVKYKGGFVIRLTRSLHNSKHKSENDADSYEGYNGIIDTQNLDITKSCDAFLDLMVDLGITKRIRKVGKFTASIR